MTDAKSIKIEESSEVRTKKRVRILEEMFGSANCKVAVEPQYDGEVYTGDLVSIKRPIYGIEQKLAYIDSRTERGNRRDEMHIQFPTLEPVVLDAVAKFFDAGLGKLRYDMNEIVVIVHYEREKDKTNDAYAEMVRTSGRVAAVQKMVAKLEEQEGQKVREE